MGEERDGTTLYYYYDSTGQIIGLNYNGVNYYALRNLQGDVVALTDKNGTKVVSYVYDSWGQVISVTGSLKDTLGKDNPFRYRGYYYDEESGFYYLQSRYYDPETCRFLNADNIDVVLESLEASDQDKNLYLYCDNNPICRLDAQGESWIAGLTIGFFLGGVIEAVNQLVSGEKLDWGGILIEAANGGLTGLALSAGLPPQTLTLARLGINMSTSVAHSINEGDSFGEAVFDVSKTAVATITVSRLKPQCGRVLSGWNPKNRVINKVTNSVGNFLSKPSTPGGSRVARGLVRVGTTVGNRYIQEKKSSTRLPVRESLSAYDFYEKYILGR